MAQVLDVEDNHDYKSQLNITINSHMTGETITMNVLMHDDGTLVKVVGCYTISKNDFNCTYFSTSDGFTESGLLGY